VWALPVDLRVKHDLAHQELITAQENSSKFLGNENLSHAMIIHVTAELDRRAKIYQNILSKIKDFLYHAMPHWKYDYHLEEYGFKQENYHTIPLSDWVDFSFLNTELNESVGVFGY